MSAEEKSLRKLEQLRERALVAVQRYIEAQLRHDLLFVGPKISKGKRGIGAVEALLDLTRATRKTKSRSKPN